MNIMSLFSNYIRNIAIYLIFMAFVGLIIPQTKYKDYINLTMSFILIFIVLAPLKGILGDLSEPFARLENKLQANVMAYEYDKYDAAGRELVINEFTNQINDQLKERFGANYINSNVIADSSEENFGTLQEIHVTVSETPQEAKEAFIRIEPVTIESVSVFSPESESEAPVENEWVKSIKFSISNVYNVPEANIYVNVQKN